MRTRTVIFAVAGTTAAAMLLSGCGSGGSAGSSHLDALHVAVGAHTAGGATAADSGGAPNFGVQNSAGTVRGLATAPTSSAGALAPSQTGGTGSSSGTGTLISDDESVIRRAELTVGVKAAPQVAVQANAAEAIIGNLGGEVSGDNRQSGAEATATLTLLVPPVNLIKALSQLSALGAEQSRSLSSENVTTQVADVNARVISANASIATLRTLFKAATKVGDVIEIEQELASRQSDLESLEAQQKALNDETAKATISLVLTTAAPPVVPKKPTHRGGVVGALSRGWDHFLSAGAWVLSAIAAVGPWAVLLLLVGAGALRLRRRRVTPTPTPDAA